MADRLIRWRWAIGIAALVASGFAYAFWPQPREVEVAEVTHGPMEETVTDAGYTRAREVYEVSAPVTGYLARIALEPGDSVRRGDRITTMRGMQAHPLDPRTSNDLRAALAEAVAGERAALVSVRQARSDLARAEALAARGFLPRAQLEAARTRVAVGDASVAQARAVASRIRADLAQPGGMGGSAVPIVAPASGVVLTLATESEGPIAQGTPLMTIGNPRAIEAVIELLSRDAERVRLGAPVVFTAWGGSAPLRGQVRLIEPFGRLKISALGIEERRVHVIADFSPADLAAAARLGHGFQFDASVTLWRDRNAVRVPVGALFRGPDGGWRVFALDAGRARVRPVRIGKLTDTYAQVLGGLIEGDHVVLDPAAELADGARVSARAPS